jgi:hypothetical protein
MAASGRSRVHRPRGRRPGARRRHPPKAILWAGCPPLWALRQSVDLTKIADGTLWPLPPAAGYRSLDLWKPFAHRIGLRGLRGALTLGALRRIAASSHAPLLVESREG